MYIHKNKTYYVENNHYVNTSMLIFIFTFRTKFYTFCIAQIIHILISRNTKIMKTSSRARENAYIVWEVVYVHRNYNNFYETSRYMCRALLLILIALIFSKNIEKKI